MVVFTCNHCGDSLQKPKVEKHYQFRCRNAKNLTCIDCLKDFLGEDYVAHIKCISEDARYSAKGTPAENFAKKGEAKQETWIDMIHSIVNNQTDIKLHLKDLLNGLLKYNNVPRKKAKFFNFMKASSGNRISEQDVEAIWGIIENYKSQKAGEEKPGEANKRKLEGTTDGKAKEPEIKKMKKQKEEIAKNEKSECKRQADDENEQSSGKVKKAKKATNDAQDGDDLGESNTKKNKKMKKSAKENDTQNEKNLANDNEESNSKIMKKTKKAKKSNGVADEENKIEESGDKTKEKKKKSEKVNGIQKEENTINGANGVVGEGVNKINFDCKEKIREILGQKSNMPLDKLQKKMVKHYTKVMGEISNVDKFHKKIRKTLKKIPDIEVENDIVKIIEQ